MRLCTKCKKQEATPGYKRCEACRERGRKDAARSYERNKAARQAYGRAYGHAYTAAQRRIARELS